MSRSVHFLGMATALCLAQASCMHTRYSTGEARATHRPTQRGSNHFFLYGLVNDSTVPADEICRSKGLAAIETRQSFFDGVLSVITLGIYTPRSYKVWCARAVDPRVAPVAPAVPAAPVAPVAGEEVTP